LREAVRAGLRCIRIVHGKGHGSPGREPVLKAKVKSWLMQQDAVLAFTYARAADGGHGALIVLLRPGPGRGSLRPSSASPSR
jgi:DNA-nicking Smr family endonuclease